MTNNVKLNIGRVLVVIGLIIGLESLSQTFKHIGDPRFLISPASIFRRRRSNIKKKHIPGFPTLAAKLLAREIALKVICFKN